MTTPFDWIAPDLLPLIWFVLIGILLAGYCILDGFDLGVGTMHPFVTRNENDRRLSINSIGPLWDGNEVWLVTFGGALFAMFPFAYATIFSAFYTPLILLLFALIFRAVSMEFRGKMQRPWLRRAWDYGFSIGSTLAAFILGVAGGNLIAGLPLNSNGVYTGSLAEQLQPYGLFSGLFIVALFATHGGIFLHMKLDGELQARVAKTTLIAWGIMAILYVVLTLWTILGMPRAIANFEVYPWLWLIPIINLTLVLWTGINIYKRRAFIAFIANAATIVSLVMLLAAALFPNLINATNPQRDLSIADASSSDLTLKIGLVVVAIGLPFVLFYTSVIYWTFRGKTQLTSHSY